MKNKNGMVVAEVLVAFIVCGIILTISIQMFKSNDLSKKPFIYSVMKNLPMVNTVIADDCYREGTCSEKRQLPLNRKEYCLRLANNLTVTGNINCELHGTDNPEDYRTLNGVKYYYNFRMTNGVAFYGLTNTDDGTSDTWQSIAKNLSSDYANQYIDIFVDLNSKYGNNVFGDDVIPIRIFKNGDIIPGLITGDDVTTREQYYNNADIFGYNVVLNEFDADNGSLKTNSIDLRTEDEINANDPPKFTVSFREAVCRAYNNVNDNNDGKADELLTRYYGYKDDYWCELDGSDYAQAGVCQTAEGNQNQHCTIEIAKPKSSAFARLFGL